MDVLKMVVNSLNNKSIAIGLGFSFQWPSPRKYRWI
jgi:hypothetical protein